MFFSFYYFVISTEHSDEKSLETISLRFFRACPQQHVSHKVRNDKYRKCVIPSERCDEGSLLYIKTLYPFQIYRQISFFRICCCYKSIFLFASPSLNLLFSRNRIINIFKFLKVKQIMTIIFLRKAFYFPLFMF